VAGSCIATPITASTAAVVNRFVVSVNMANGPYTVANASPPWAGGCLVTATITANTGNDTPGTLGITGTGIDGRGQTETITLVAAGTATSTRVWRTITNLNQNGWVINGGNDTITVGCAAGAIPCDTDGTLYGIVVNTTAAAAVVVSDANKTIATLKASIAEGHYLYGPGVDFVGPLKVSTTGANDITVLATPTRGF
jgi:hypothetical protein